MKELKLIVFGQTLAKDGDSEWNDLIHGTKDEYYFSFEFDEAWSAAPKRAMLFRVDDFETYMPILKGICALPNEVSKYKKIYVSLICENEKGERVFTNEVEVKQK